MGLRSTTESLSLNGFTTTTIQLPTPGPGVHTLEGILAAGGLSSKKETKFLYGTNLPDLTADVWGSGTAIGKDGTLKLIAIAGNRGKTVATPTSMTLHDGSYLLATFTVGELAAGASQSYEYLWNVLGKAGEHTLVAMLDPGSSLTEFTKENNRATRRIVVPNIALITETEKESYRYWRAGHNQCHHHQPHGRNKLSEPYLHHHCSGFSRHGDLPAEQHPRPISFPECAHECHLEHW